MNKSYLIQNLKEDINLGIACFKCNSNIRASNNTNSEIIDTAKTGSQCIIVGFDNGWYKVSSGGKKGFVRSDLLSLDSENNTSQQETSQQKTSQQENHESNGETIANGSMSYNAKLKMVFGTTSVADHRLVYKTEAEAKVHMKVIHVKTWDKNSSGGKYTRTWALTVHEKIAPTVQKIFDEIYALAEKPIIHSLGGYRWSTKSEHSVGLAVDINPNENYYCTLNGCPLTGRYFRPGVDPYSIPVDGKIDRIFAKYGFTRGIYWKNSGTRDYMHYSFFGT